MKKIILTISIIICSIALAIVLVIIIPTNMKDLSVSNYYNEETLKLGEYKVNNYKKEKYANKLESIIFDVDNANLFYNDVIKTNDYYNSDLDFNIEGYYAYGFMCISKYVFRYTIIKKTVCIEACFGIYQVTDEDINNNHNYYIPGPFEILYLNKNGFLNMENNYYVIYDLKFNQLVKLFSYLPKDFYSIESNEILFKGEEKRFDDNQLIYSDYVVKAVNVDNEIRVMLIE